MKSIVKVTLNKLDDGTFHKVTQTDKVSDFEFPGDTYSYSQLDGNLECHEKLVKE